MTIKRNWKRSSLVEVVSRSIDLYTQLNGAEWRNLSCMRTL